MKNKSKLIFAFDVGMTSLGVAVNKDNEIIHADSILIHALAGSTKKQSERRRQYRTRQSHKQREKRLEKLWKDIGKEPLQRKTFTRKKSGKGFDKIPADDRLEREFPSKGDETVYNGALLRIMLIEGQHLEDWQIYKALSAAIQRKGYDSDVAWKSQKENKKEKKETEERIESFDNLAKEMTADVQHHLPCYLDAWKMNLWNSETKKIVSKNNNTKTKKARNQYIAPAKVVEKECKLLLEQATKQIPALEKHIEANGINTLLFGSGDAKNHTSSDRYPSYSNIDGILAQKYPRFENRVLNNCSLMPRFHVCKANSKLAIETMFLLRLYNFRYDSQNGKVSSLKLEKIKCLLKQKCEEAKKELKNLGQALNNEPDPMETYNKIFSLNANQVKKIVKELKGRVKINHEKIEKGNISGRSRYSSPALFVLEQLILKGIYISDFKREVNQLFASCKDKNEFGYKIFEKVSYRYFQSDFDFLEYMSGDKFYLTSLPLSVYYNNLSSNLGNTTTKLIAQCKWPEVAHRLKVFRNTLQQLQNTYGIPDYVHIEFVREDFLSEKKKKKFEKDRDEGQKRKFASY